MATPATNARVLATGLGAAYAGALWFSGVQPADGVKQAVTYLPAAAVFLVLVWDKWLWKWPGLHKLSRRPRLDGSWRATIMPTSNSVIPEGGHRGPIPGFVVIRQTFWTIGVTQFTLESRSHSHAALWADVPSHGRSDLAFTYINEPRQELEERSKLHRGTTILEITGLSPRTILGCYFTDRYTKGDLSLVLLDRQARVSDYRTAVDQYGVTG